MKSYDVIGSIAILKFPEEVKEKQKKKAAEKLLKERKNVKTVVEKTEKVKGRLRTIKTRHLAGINTKETIHAESGCRFFLNIDKTYFSPRLSNERLEVAKLVKKKDRVLVMFAGVAPFSIVIAKKSKPKKVVSVEINRQASKYALENVKLNKLNNVEVIQGDVKRIIPKISRKEKFDVIIMPRPQLKESFLKQAFKSSKKGSLIVYYDFGKDVSGILERIYKESKEAKKKIKIKRVKKAGEIAPYKHMFRVEFIIN